MAAKSARTFLGSLDLEDRILNAGALVGVLGVFLPWIAGEWRGDEYEAFRGTQFYTAFIGIAVLLLLVFILSVTLVPAFGGPVFPRRHLREWARLLASGQAVILLLSALTVLTNVTSDSSRMRVRYGIYVSLIGAILTTIYAFLKLQQQRRLESLEHFRHPDDPTPAAAEPAFTHPTPPPPPPPPPLEPEEHHLR